MIIDTRAPARAQKHMETGQLRAAIVMPYNPKMNPGRECESRQKTMLARLERELMARHPAESALPFIHEIQQAFRSLNSATHKSSVVVFAKAGAVNVLYMDLPVKETVVVDRPFAVKDILNYRVEGNEHLVLLLNNRSSRIFLGSGGAYRIIKSNTPQNVYAYLNEVPERAANFPDPSGRREVMLDKFLHHMDEGLGSILSAWPRPVFVVGDPRVTGHFAKLTRHEKNILAYIRRDPREDGNEEWQKALGPYLAGWEKLRQQYALQLVQKAVDAGRLATGIAEVSRQARYHNSRLLVLEKGFTGQEGTTDEDFYITDPVDKVIWQVLANGGNVEWVGKDDLRDMNHIALVQLY
ncbi:MAG TPA: hypothetical protein VN616_12265 [Puia sp.]|nr:hypothetical protein [Puia sp.]